MMLFVLFAALMLAAALAFVLPPLLRGPRDSGATVKLKALAEAHAAGVLSDAEYATKRAALGEQSPNTRAVPARVRSTRIATVALALLLPATAILLYRYVGNPE